jgi:hypothetical protein
MLAQAGLLSKWIRKTWALSSAGSSSLAHRRIVRQHQRDVLLPLCSILDSCNRYIMNGDLRESMTEADIEVILFQVSWKCHAKGHARRA